MRFSITPVFTGVQVIIHVYESYFEANLIVKWKTNHVPESHADFFFHMYGMAYRLLFIGGKNV